MEHYDLTPIRKYWRRIINFFLEFYYILSLKKKNNNNNNKNLQFNSSIESQGLQAMAFDGNSIFLHTALPNRCKVTSQNKKNLLS